MRIVLDSSVALTWVLPGQLNAASEEILRRVKLDGAWVPPIWALEVANILGLKIRDRNMSDAELSDAFRVLELLDIRTDADQLPFGVGECVGHVVRFQVAAYDALYLELAVRSRCALATFDKAMAASARRFGIPLLGAA